MYEVLSGVHYLGLRPFLYFSLRFCAERFVTTYDREIRLIRPAPGGKQVQTTA